jgi:hypothetical protein
MTTVKVTRSRVNSGLTARAPPVLAHRAHQADSSRCSRRRPRPNGGTRRPAPEIHRCPILGRVRLPLDFGGCHHRGEVGRRGIMLRRFIEPGFGHRAAALVGGGLPFRPSDVPILIPLRRWRHPRRTRCGCGCALHQHEARRPQMLDKPIGGDPRHHTVGVVHALSSLILQRKRKGVGDFVRCGGAEVGAHRACRDGKR